MTGTRTASKLWLVAQYEYKRHVLRGRFVWALLSVPLTLALMVMLILFMESQDKDLNAIGYVDQAGLLAHPIPAPVDDPDEAVTMLPFESREAAQRALEAEDIQAYYVLPPDYFQSNQGELVYIKTPGDNATRQFWDFMQINWLSDQPPEIARRLALSRNSDLIQRLPDGSREFHADPTLNDFLPLITTFAFVMVVFTTSGQLMQTVTEEKENRTIEIIMTSISPGQLIGGKVLGNAGIGLTQIFTWCAFALLAAWVGGHYMGLEWLLDAHIEPQVLLMLLGLFLPSYILTAALMTMIGATIAEVQEGQQIAGMLVIPFMAPIWLLGVIVGHANGPLSIGLSLFPATAPMTLAIRVIVTQIPAWQAVSSITILVLSALGATWLAGRAFRLGMLRYGQRLNWAELLRKTEAKGLNTPRRRPEQGREP